MKKVSGFTVIELLVVISIISLLSSIVLSSLSETRSDARLTTAKSQLRSIRSGIEQMINDTGAWPGGCTPGYVNSNILIYLDDSESGLTNTQPSQGKVSGYYGGNPCTWSANEVNNWNGPYVNTDKLIDPWGNPYVIDTKYRISPAPPNSNSCPAGTLRGSEKYKNGFPYIYSQAKYTRSNGQGRVSESNPEDYYAVCDDVRVNIY